MLIVLNFKWLEMIQAYCVWFQDFQDRNRIQLWPMIIQKYSYRLGSPNECRLKFLPMVEQDLFRTKTYLFSLWSWLLRSCIVYLMRNVVWYIWKSTLPIVMYCISFFDGGTVESMLFATNTFIAQFPIKLPNTTENIMHITSR